MWIELWVPRLSSNVSWNRQPIATAVTSAKYGMRKQRDEEGMEEDKIKVSKVQFAVVFSEYVWY